jgi:tRNA pseudouridine55 synthase
MVGGERTYARARAGEAVQPGPVRVTAYALEVLSLEGARAQLQIRCSAGFYVRSLAHDLGERLGTGAILDGLVRTEAAGFRLEDTIPFTTLVTGTRDTVRAAIRPMASLLTHIPGVVLTPQGVEWARHGRAIPPRLLVGEMAAAAPLVRLIATEGTLIGLAEPRAPGLLQPAVIFSYN